VFGDLVLVSAFNLIQQGEDSCLGLSCGQPSGHQVIIPVSKPIPGGKAHPAEGSTDPTTSTLTTAAIPSGESWRSGLRCVFILSSNLLIALGGRAFTHLAADGSCRT